MVDWLLDNELLEKNEELMVRWKPNLS
jgi:hypothetical protein